MEQKAKFQVIYNGETLEFEHGAQAYIFDYALYWDIDKLGLNVLKAFVYFVYRCYMKDDNATPLGALTDYIAEHWTEIQGKQPDIYDILADFYAQLP
jgi:hypothetical protein